MTNNVVEANISRIAKVPLTIPSTVEFKLENGVVTTKGPKGQLTLVLNPFVKVEQTDHTVSVIGLDKPNAKALSGTYYRLVKNLITGVFEGFEKKLILKGVGYRAKLSGNKLELTLGKSHPDFYTAPEGITISCPSNTEVVVSGCDKQLVGQVSAEIRAFRPPEYYKGKGIRYENEEIILKEGKKK